MGDCCVRIERLTNGYKVSMRDPAIEKANDKRDDSKEPYVPYKDPWREFVFTTEDEVLVFLKKNLKKAIASKGDDFKSSFDLAAKESD